MSDFITRLAQRQLGQIASVMPRLPEVFAPFAGPMPTLSAEEIPAAAPAQRQNDFVPRPTVGAAAQPASFASAADLTETSNLVQAVRSSGAAQHAENRVVEPPLAAFPVKTESSQTKPNSSYDGERPLTPRAFSEQSGLADVLKEAPPLPARPVNDQPTQYIAIASSAPGAITAPPRLEPQKTSRRVAVAPAAGIADAEPPVHVTIGRIEVTALTQAAPAKRVAAPRKPAMSLDDYLSRRQRGER